MPDRAQPEEQRRRFSRVLFSAAAIIRVGASEHACTIHDLSFKGALLHLDDAPVAADASVATGAPCCLELRLGDDNDLIRMDAVVAHVAGKRLGIRCRSIDLDSISHLRRLVELNAGDEAVLQRDFSALLSAN